MTNNTNITIHKTKDYDQFKLFHMNRVINKGLVGKLKRNIKKKNLLIDRPILVDEDMHVLDGQHRLRAARELDADVYFVEANATTVNDIPSLQLSRNWNSYDYMNMYIKEKNENYIKIDAFIREHSLPSISFALSLFSKKTMAVLSSDGNSRPAASSSIGSAFNNGHFQYPSDDSYARIVMQNIYEVLNYIDYKKTKAMMSALLIIITDERYHHDILIKRIKEAPARIRQANTCGGWVNEFERIYNYKQGRRNYIRFARAA